MTDQQHHPRRPVRRRKSVNHYSDDNPSTFTVKRKKGEPEPTPSKPRSVQRRTPSPSPAPFIPRKRKLRFISDPPAPPSDEIISHKVSLRPVLPLSLHEAGASSSSSSLHDNPTNALDLQQRYPNVFLMDGCPPPPPKPGWTKVTSAYRGDLLHRRYGSGDEVVEVPPPAVTCWTRRVSSQLPSKCQQPVMIAVGDVAGGVTLYDTSAARTHPVALLRTTAWKREQERTLISKKTISYPNLVRSVAWRGETIVLLTATELEVFAIRTPVWKATTAASQPQNNHWIEHPLVTLPIADLPQTVTPMQASRQSNVDVLPHSDGTFHVLWTFDERTSGSTATALQSNAAVKGELHKEKTSSAIFSEHAEICSSDVEDKPAQVTPITEETTPMSAVEEDGRYESDGHLHPTVQSNTTTSNYVSGTMEELETSCPSPGESIVDVVSALKTVVDVSTQATAVADLITVTKLHERTGTQLVFCDDLEPPEVIHLSSKDEGPIRTSSATDESCEKAEPEPGVCVLDECSPLSEANLVFIHFTESRGKYEHTIQHAAPIDSSDSSVRWCFLMALWDAWFSKNNPVVANRDPTYLAIVATSATQVDIVRCGALSGKIWNRAEGWTANVAVTATPHCQLEQSCGDARYTFLMGNFKGIKVLETATLTCLQVLGESVALHGKTVQWHSCQLVPRPPSYSVGEEAVRRYKKQAWLERNDEVARRNGDVELQDDENECWMVGLPHPFKGPDELNSTLYVWQRGVATPVTTLQAPQGGCLGLVAQLDQSGGWKLVCATADTGELWEWKTSLRSNFAGVMYPVGYQVIEDNIEYIEDEDELDQRIIMDEIMDEEEDVKDRKSHSRTLSSSSSISADDDLEKALKLSLLEQRASEISKKELLCEDVDIISVLPHRPTHTDYGQTFPCRPDRFVFRSFCEDSAHGPGSPIVSPQKKDGFESDVLLLLPQTTAVRKRFTTLKQQQAAVAQQAPGPSEGQPMLSLPPRIKGKRTKVANVETLLQASIKPELRHFVCCAQAMWADGTGSSYGKNRRTPTPLVQMMTSDETGTQQGRHCSAKISPQSNPSSEEKELALELLLLGPRHSATPSMDASQIPSAAEPGVELDPCVKNAPLVTIRQQCIVTPSDSNSHGESSTIEEHAKKHKMDDDEEMNVAPKTCGACNGRMIMHTCGKRERPVDYEAIERAERERKEQEEAEKHRLRTEKRRAADARRREARKKKKEEEDLRRREEEKKRWEEEESLRRIEASQFDVARVQENHNTPHPAHSCRPSNVPPSTSRAAHGNVQTDDFVKYRVPEQHKSQFKNVEISDVSLSKHPFVTREPSTFRTTSESHSIASSASLRNEPLRIDGNEVQPSTSLSASDALAALAGLADSMPVAVSGDQEMRDVDDLTGYPSAPIEIHESIPPRICTIRDVREAFPPAPASWYSHVEHDTIVETVDTSPALLAPSPTLADVTAGRDAFPPAAASWYAHPQMENQETYSVYVDGVTTDEAATAAFVYQGSEDRRTAIAQAFLGTLDLQASTSLNGGTYAGENNYTNNYSSVHGYGISCANGNNHLTNYDIVYKTKPDVFDDEKVDYDCDASATNHVNHQESHSLYSHEATKQGIYSNTDAVQSDKVIQERYNGNSPFTGTRTWEGSGKD